MLMKPQHFYYPDEDVAAAITAAATDSPVAAALRVFLCLLAVASLACGEESSDLVLLFFIDWKVIVLVHLPKRHRAHTNILQIPTDGRMEPHRNQSPRCTHVKINNETLATFTSWDEFFFLEKPCEYFTGSLHSTQFPLPPYFPFPSFFKAAT